MLHKKSHAQLFHEWMNKQQNPERTTKELLFMWLLQKDKATKVPNMNFIEDYVGFMKFLGYWKLELTLTALLHPLLKKNLIYWIMK